MSSIEEILEKYYRTKGKKDLVVLFERYFGRVNKVSPETVCYDVRVT